MRTAFSGAASNPDNPGHAFYQRVEYFGFGSALLRSLGSMTRKSRVRHMTLIFAALILVLVGAAIFATELVRRRRERRAVENRLNLVAKAKQNRTETPDAFRGLLKAGDQKNRHFLPDGYSQSELSEGGRMRSGTLTLLLAAPHRRCVVWILPMLFSVPHRGCRSLLASPRCSSCRDLFSPRQQKRVERKFTDEFPDALDTVARMILSRSPDHRGGPNCRRRIDAASQRSVRGHL